MAILQLGWKSLRNRRFSIAITILSIALSVALLVGVERIRTETKTGFTNTLSGTDLIVGARSGPVPLLLYSVFRIGNATNNISWQSYQEIAAKPQVAWTIPLSLGDSHKGYRVLGTNLDYFKYYRYGGKKALALFQGKAFKDLYEVVLGAEVARALHYQLGDRIVIAHGAGNVSFTLHDDKPFQVSGILAPTGTPVDRTLHVSLKAIEAIHVDWQQGVKLPSLSISAEKARQMDLTPKAITAFLVGLKSKIATFRMQRTINEYRSEPLLAILPGVALTELWGVIGIGEQALLIVSVCVVVVGLFGMLTALLIGLNERRREMAILRSVGARPWQIFALILSEALGLSLLGIIFGTGLMFSLLLLGQGMIETRLGLQIGLSWLSARELMLLGAILLAGLIAGLIPAYRAYRSTLSDGLSIRI